MKIFLLMLETSKANFTTIPTSSSIGLSKVDGISKISLKFEIYQYGKMQRITKQPMTTKLIQRK
jgi:hypothetical protein